MFIPYIKSQTKKWTYKNKFKKYIIIIFVCEICSNDFLYRPLYYNGLYNAPSQGLVPAANNKYNPLIADF